MDQRSERHRLYLELKEQGWVPARHYRTYSHQDLLDIQRSAAELQRDPASAYAEATSAAEPPSAATAEDPTPVLPQVEALPPLVIPDPEPIPVQAPVLPPRMAAPDPQEMAGQRLNTKDDEDVIRIDDQGRRWLQEEVRKPAYPKPRGRRVLTYMDTGVTKETVQNGDYVETFEVAGVGAPRASEVKITLPSYQVGIYRDPRFPFRVHVYNEQEGFNLFDVHEFYGGAELVPQTCRRIYIENDLCYDVRSVVASIQAEHRHLQLTGKIQ